ncbi:hypothetical protein ZIOFF_002738 [Zingiber officinale]|uniref:Uncharacterized protein n=1 Tax=Zingiber officinale TaxID=94328 RepID=A0A8J5I845_ZINOF|nr:hypothetical protein ZIOFF_002738 [Zingiber officinale]
MDAPGSCCAPPLKLVPFLRPIMVASLPSSFYRDELRALSIIVDHRSHLLWKNDQLSMERNGGAAATATPSWEELLGSNNWSGLLSPLDEALHDHLLRCGSFYQIVGDSFISDSQSNNVGKIIL